MVAHDDVLAQVGVVADFAIPPDDGRAFDHHAVLDHRPFADEHILPDMHARVSRAARPGLDMRFDVGLEFFQRLPGMLASLEQLGVRGLAQIKQIARLEHRFKLLTRGPPAIPIKSERRAASVFHFCIAGRQCLGTMGGFAFTGYYHDHNQQTRRMSKIIKLQVLIKAAPAMVFGALMNSKKHSQFTGAPARISRKVGGTFACYDNYITGVNLALQPGKFIVQAWRSLNGLRQPGPSSPSNCPRFP